MERAGDCHWTRWPTSPSKTWRILRQRPGGNLKNSEQVGSVYFFGSEIWPKFTFLGENIRIIFFGRKFLKLSFDVTRGGKAYFLGRSRYWMGYFLVHNSFKKKHASTHYTHIKVGQRKGYFN